MRRTSRSNKRTYLLLFLLFLIIIIMAVFLYLNLNPQGGTGQSGVLPGIPTVPTVVPKVRVLIARQTIPARTVLTAELVGQLFKAEERERSLEIGENVIGSERQLIGYVTLVEIKPEELLYTFQFTPATLSYKIPKNKRAMPLKVDQFSGVVGQLHAGDYVDIVFSGAIEMHFPQVFPPSPEEPPIYLSPVSLLAVKTILQDVQVLEVIPITVSSGMEQSRQPTPTPSEGGPPAGAARPTEWILILAVTDQEAEVLRFVQDQGMTYQLLLRAPDDHDMATTTGMTTKILVETYEVPKPEQLRYEITPGQLPSGIVP